MSSKAKKKHHIRANKNKKQVAAIIVVCMIVAALISIVFIPSHKAPAPQSPIYGPLVYFRGAVPPEISYGDRTKKQVILTFDGGEGNDSADAILSTLHAKGLRGTFFLTGAFVDRNQALVKRIHTEGHEIYNHTNSHPHLTTLSSTAIATELERMDSKIRTITGSSTKPFFRPPYGDRDSHVALAAAQAGYRSVYWSVDALDWQESSGMTDDVVEQRILNGLHPGSIVLMHVGDTITGRILGRVIDEIRNRGYELVSLSQGI